MGAGLRVVEGGSGEPVLLLLHGLGATGDVWREWRPLLGRRWPGRWLAPDLPGHGGSRPLPGYTFESLAAAVAGIVPVGARTVVLGHSLGGVVGLALASGAFTMPVQAVIGLGIKVHWTQQELDRAQAAARRPPAWFASREQAAARYLRISGLAGLLPAADPAVDEGLREEHGRWRLAVDPGAFAVGAPDMTHLLARSQAPVMLARGEHDAMNTDEQLGSAGRPRGHAARPGAQRTCGEPAPDDQGPGPVPVTPGGQAIPGRGYQCRQPPHDRDGQVEDLGTERVRQVRSWHVMRDPAGNAVLRHPGTGRSAATPMRNAGTDLRAIRSRRGHAQPSAIGRPTTRAWRRPGSRSR